MAIFPAQRVTHFIPLCKGSSKGKLPVQFQFGFSIFAIQVPGVVSTVVLSTSSGMQSGRAVRACIILEPQGPPYSIHEEISKV